MNTIKLTELTVRELETVKGGIQDQDTIGTPCACPGTSADAFANQSDW